MACPQKLQEAPTSLDSNQSECIINKEDPSQAGAQEALQSVIPAPEDTDDRNWRTRTELPPQEVLYRMISLKSLADLLVLFLGVLTHRWGTTHVSCTHVADAWHCSLKPVSALLPMK